MAKAVADARRAAVTETAEETRAAATRDLMSVLEKEKEESKRAVEAAVRSKDREMAKALKVGSCVRFLENSGDISRLGNTLRTPRLGHRLKR